MTDQNSAYETTCDPVTGICTATLKVSTRGAYPIPAERVSSLIGDRLKSAAHDTKTDGPEYLGYGYSVDLAKTRAAGFEIDETKRIIPFIASTPIVDRYGDIIEQAGWNLDFYHKNPVCLWGHDSRNLPVARSVKCEVINGQLVNFMQFATADVWDFADRVYRMVLGGFLSTVSVGFIPISFEWIMADPDPETGYQRITGRRYTSSELLETSVVNVPANPDCLVVGRGFEAALRAFEKDDDVTFIPKIADSQNGGNKVFGEPCDAAYFVIHEKGSVSRFGTNNPFDHKEIDDLLFAFVPDSGAAVRFSSVSFVDAEGRAEKEFADGFLCELIGADGSDEPVYRATLRISKASPDENEEILRAEKKSGKKTQTVIFSKKYWTEPRAKKWVAAHNLKTSDPQHSDTSWRYRQFPPSECAENSYETLTQNMPKGLSLGVCNKKEKSADAADQKTSMPCSCSDANKNAQKGAVESRVEDKSVVPFHHYQLAPSDAPWDASKEMSSTDKPEDWRKMSTIVLNDGKNKGDFKLPHHKGPGGKFATVRRGVANALARANQVKGASSSDKAGARKHLTKHMAEFHKEDGKDFNEAQFLEELRLVDAFIDALPEASREAAMRDASEWILGASKRGIFFYAKIWDANKAENMKQAAIAAFTESLPQPETIRGFNDPKMQKKVARIRKRFAAAKEAFDEMSNDVGDAMGQVCSLADDVNGAFPPSKDAPSGVTRDAQRDTNDGDQPEPAAVSIGDATITDKLRAMHVAGKSARRSANRSMERFSSNVREALDDLGDLLEAISDDDDDSSKEPDADEDDSQADPSGEENANANADDELNKPTADSEKDVSNTDVDISAIIAETTKLLTDASKEVAGAPARARESQPEQRAATEATSVDDAADIVKLISEGMR